MKNVILCILLGLKGHPKTESAWYTTIILVITALWSYDVHGYHTAWVWACAVGWLLMAATYLVMAYCLGRLKQLGGEP